MTYSSDSDIPINLPEFDLEDYQFIVDLGIPPEQAIETAIEIMKPEDPEQ